MLNLPTPLDPMGLTRTGIATWMTDVIVAWKIGEALLQQSALTVDAMHSACGLRPDRRMAT
jgi:hypothetical protein